MLPQSRIKPANGKFNGTQEKKNYNTKEEVLQGLPPTNHLPLKLWPPAKAEGIPDVIRAEDAGSTENVFSYEYEGSDLRVLLLSVRQGTVSPTPAFRLGLGDPRRIWVLYIPKVIRAEDAGSTENFFHMHTKEVISVSSYPPCAQVLFFQPRPS